MNAARINNERKPSVLRRVVKVTASLMLILLVGFLILLGIAYKQNQDDPRYGTIEELIDRAESQGGSLVECVNRVCRDVKTHEYQGFAERDGFFIIFPQDKISAEELEKKRKEVERLMSK